MPNRSFKCTCKQQTNLQEYRNMLLILYSLCSDKYVIDTVQFALWCISSEARHRCCPRKFNLFVQLELQFDCVIFVYLRSTVSTSSFVDADLNLEVMKCILSNPWGQFLPMQCTVSHPHLVNNFRPLGMEPPPHPTTSDSAVHPILRNWRSYMVEHCSAWLSSSYCRNFKTPGILIRLRSVGVSHRPIWFVLLFFDFLFAVGVIERIVHCGVITNYIADISSRVL